MSQITLIRKLKRRTLFIHMGYYTLFHLHSEFDKNANFIYVNECNVLRIDIVWRLSEFAFFVRWPRLAHFLIFRKVANIKMPHYVILR